MLKKTFKINEWNWLVMIKYSTSYVWQQYENETWWTGSYTYQIMNNHNAFYSDSFPDDVIWLKITQEFWFHLELLTWLRCFLSPEPLREESSSLTSSSSELRMSVTSWSETKRTNQKSLNNSLWLVCQRTNQRLENMWLVWLWIIRD